MKRVDSDEHDSNTFQDENLPTTPGTLIEETWLNALQTEIVEAIECYDAIDQSQAASPLNEQLKGLIQGNRIHGLVGPSSVSSWRPSGSAGDFMPVVPGSGLVATMPGGVLYVSGRRVEITDARMAELGDDSHTYLASRDTYVQLHYDGAGHTAAPILYIDVTLADPAPTPAAGYTNVAYVTTNASDVTGSTNLLLTSDPVFTTLPHFNSGIELKGINLEDGLVIATHQQSAAEIFQGDETRKWTVRETTQTNGMEAIVLGYTVPTQKDVFVTVHAHGVDESDMTHRYRYYRRQAFYRGTGSTTDDTLGEEGTSASSGITGFAIDLTTSTNALQLEYTSTDSGPPIPTIHHAITVEVSELTHNDT